jgi:N-acetyl-anhydromuramyl-L-alanine amidase AmpD
MFPFKKTFPSPAERSKGINTKQFVIIHHTGTGEGTINGVLDGLYRRPDYASCHFVVDTNGDAYKIGSPDDILWHAGESQWGKFVMMNNFSIWIEVIGPLKNGGFTDVQRKVVRDLTQHLMATFNIPSWNVLRHRDITSSRAYKGELALPGDLSRKIDIADTFWNGQYKSFDEYRKSLVPHVL